jgi:hypothetical protein
LGLGLSEGLGSALLDRPSLEPAVLLAHWLLLTTAAATYCFDTSGARPLSFDLMPQTAAKDADA